MVSECFGIIVDVLYEKWLEVYEYTEIYQCYREANECRYFVGMNKNLTKGSEDMKDKRVNVVILF